MAETMTRRAGWPAERRFYTFMSLAIFAAVWVGFARTFFLRPWFPEHATMAPPESFFYLHGAVFTAWFVLLVVQPALIGVGRTDLHRALGRVGVVVAAAVVVTGVTGALIAARRAGGFVGIPVPPASFLLIPLTDMLLFSTFFVLAILSRRNAQSHKRLMIVGSLCLLDAAIARWPGVIDIGNPLLFFALTDLFLIPLVVWDLKSRGRLHPVTVWCGLLLVVSQPLRLWLSGTDAWLAFASRIL
jgi:hypothetical protein